MRQTQYDDENGRIQALRETLETAKKTQEDTRKDAELTAGYEALYGVPAVEAVEEVTCNNGDNDCTPQEAVEAVPEVKGIEQQKFDAERALTQANAALARAEQALQRNTDPENVETLVHAVRDATQRVLDKEGELLEKRSFFNVLNAEIERLQTARDKDFEDELNATLATS